MLEGKRTGILQLLHLLPHGPQYKYFPTARKDESSSPQTHPLVLLHGRLLKLSLSMKRTSRIRGIYISR
jgi:hypothetical protein